MADVDDGSPQAKKRKTSSDRGNNSKEVESKPTLTPPGQFIVFSDPIHGPIEMHPLMVRIIDTPQFQRLRGIKQLGGGYYVYPGASHNRFEHSLGVAHLAGQLVEALRRNQPELEITDKDVLCVKIAGLCHDLGHGPFSHLFDGMFIPRVCDKKWKHEQGSVEMLEHLIKTNKLEEHFEREGLGELDIIFITEQINGLPISKKSSSKSPYEGRDSTKSFLYEIVANKRNGMDVDKWDYFARDCHHLGIGSTFDHRRYMAFARALDVKGEEGTKQICARDKDAHNMYDMFYVRKTLHQRAYQHKTVNAVEFMVRDILVLANDYITITGGFDEEECKIRECTMSKCIEDMTAYTKLDDSILDIIKADPSSELAPARELICRLKSRRLYKYIGETSPIVFARYYLVKCAVKMAKEIIVLAATREKENGSDFEPGDALVQMAKEILAATREKENGSDFDPEDVLVQAVKMAKEILAATREKENGSDFKPGDALVQCAVKMAKEILAATRVKPGAEKIAEAILTHTREKENGSGLKLKDVLVDVVTFDYGSGEDNPVDKMRFYSKDEPNEAGHLPEHLVSKMLPNCFSEKFVRLYCKKEASESSRLEYTALKRGFESWCEKNDLALNCPNTSCRKSEQLDEPILGREEVARNLKL